jgi:outer membrane protein OmpA-like peptidoglycan-associated protein
VSNSNRDPKNQPPDDFSMTTPNIRFPKADSPKEEPLDDWAKTNYNFSSPKQSPPADEWGKTAVNINAPRNQPEDDFGKTLPPGQYRKEPNWDATQANINVPRGGYEREDYGGRGEPEYKATMPYFQLPESERAKYQNLPPAQTPSESEKTNEKKGGIPMWVWAAGGLGVIFLIALAMIALVYFVFLQKRGFDVVVKGAPAGSEIFVDNQRWNVTAPDGSYRLPGLKAGELKTIEIRRSGYKCEPQKVTGENGTQKEIIAQCTADIKPVVDECANIKKGEIEKARKCANDALANLKEPFTVEELLRAMNMYIINFPSGKYDIVDPKDKEFLQKAAGYIQKIPPNVVIEVGGHTDTDGNKAFNQVLSENRAKSVKTALIGFGVKESVLLTRGYGDSMPKASNDTEDGKFQNRRIQYSAIVR